MKKYYYLAYQLPHDPEHKRPFRGRYIILSEPYEELQDLTPDITPIKKLGITSIGVDRKIKLTRGQVFASHTVVGTEPPRLLWILWQKLKKEEEEKLKEEEALSRK